MNAAETVVRRHGPGRLTLDAVAREAGVSKGGLLHSFPSKEALVSGMLERLIARSEAAVQERVTEAAGRPGAALRGYLEGTFATADVDPGTAMSILAALPEHPRLLDPLRDFYRAHVSRIIAEATDEAAVLTPWLAAEGLLLLELLGVSPLSKEQRSAVITHLLTLAETSHA